jgi:hypothetical protein
MLDSNREDAVKLECQDQVRIGKKMKKVTPNPAQPENGDQKKFMTKMVTSDSGSKSYGNRLELGVIMEEHESPHTGLLGKDHNTRVHFAAGSLGSFSRYSQFRGITEPIKSNFKNSNGKYTVSTQNIISRVGPDTRPNSNPRKPLEKYFGKAFCFSDKTIPKHLALTNLITEENMSSLKRIWTIKSKEAASNYGP